MALCLVLVLVCGNLAPASALRSTAETQTDTAALTGRPVSSKQTQPVREGTVRVSIVLEDRSTKNIAENTSAMAYRQGLVREQADLTARIGRKLGHPLDVVWNLTLAANIISANVSYGDIEKIEAMDGVCRVVRELRYEACTAGNAEPATAVSTGMTGAAEAWNSGYTGAGSRIAIIDTGLDTTHQSFRSMLWPWPPTGRSTPAPCISAAITARSTGSIPTPLR